MKNEMKAAVVLRSCKFSHFPFDVKGTDKWLHEMSLTLCSLGKLGVFVFQEVVFSYTPFLPISFLI